MLAIVVAPDTFAVLSNNSVPEEFQATLSAP